KDAYLNVFLTFKIGMLYTTLNEQENALAYLKQSLEYTDESVPQLKINSLVGIGQIYAGLDKGDEGYPYLQEALDMLPNSTLKNSPVHMDALTEMGYYHYSQGQYDKGTTMYEEAIQMYTASRNTNPRKLGMMYMQYAYCLANQENPQEELAGTHFEKAIVQLEKENDVELLHSALNDVITFFDKIGSKSKRQYFEKRMLKLAETFNA
ncbi:MAG TPA: tetratricopeptide repeat protein, partial [Bacillota bacterium]|nr:tetratricopeptide repeat protein [Bacillota bacterium]